MGIIDTLRSLLVKRIDPATETLYRACVAAARQPVFYARLGVPDSVDGRFDLLLLHVFLVMRRLKNSEARQNLFDLMFRDMDRSLREMGVGDMSIGKKMKPLLSGFYGRTKAYEVALASGDEALNAALSRNLFGAKDGDAEHTSEIALYVRACIASLDTQNEADVMAGRVFFASAPSTEP